MNAEIIAVGSELLLGQIVNTNAQFLSQQLAQLGINVYFHTVVGDNPHRLKNALQVAEERANLIILTGGLGPTKDDLTKEIVAEQLNKELVTNEEAIKSIEQYFKCTNREMTENNRKQALIIEGSTILKNEKGMAPGMLVSENDCHYMLLPGPPHELKPMFLRSAQEQLLKKVSFKEKIVSRSLRFFGIGEALLETKIEDLIDEQSNPTIAPLASDGEVTIRITAKHESQEQANLLLDEMEQLILDRVGQYFYGYDHTSLMNELVKLLKKANLTIASAESLTGGMFQEKITEIPGTGAIFKGGVVTYTNEAKRLLLNVKNETINTVGVVSEQCAIEMAENIRTQLQTDVGISFTGVAGPDTLEGASVGTVYIGIAALNKKTVVHKLQLGMQRDTNRKRSVSYGCYYIIQLLKNSL